MRNRATLSPMNLTVRKPMTLAEFLEWEERQEQRYEFDGSEPVAMAGGSLAHSAIQRNLAMALGTRLRGKPCQFFGSDLKIQAAENSSRYPDGMVICSGLDPALKIVRNPVVIFEVLSPSTAAADRIVKAREYQATPSVQRYVMLEQARIGATVYVRAADGWKALVLKDDDTLVLPEIDLAIPLTEFYEGLTFDDHPAEDYDNAQAPPPDLFTALFAARLDPRRPGRHHRAAQRLLAFPEFRRKQGVRIRRAVSRHRRRGTHSVIGSAPGAIRASTFPSRG